jgi:hypothetical protein
MFVKRQPAFLFSPAVRIGFRKLLVVGSEFNAAGVDTGCRVPGDLIPE